MDFLSANHYFLYEVFHGVFKGAKLCYDGDYDDMTKSKLLSPYCHFLWLMYL